MRLSSMPGSTVLYHVTETSGFKIKALSVFLCGPTPVRGPLIGHLCSRLIIWLLISKAYYPVPLISLHSNSYEVIKSLEFQEALICESTPESLEFMGLKCVTGKRVSVQHKRASSADPGNAFWNMMAVCSPLLSAHWLEAEGSRRGQPSDGSDTFFHFQALSRFPSLSAWSSFSQPLICFCPEATEDSRNHNPYSPRCCRHCCTHSSHFLLYCTSVCTRGWVMFLWVER